MTSGNRTAEAVCQGKGTEMNPYLRAAVVQIDYHPALIVGGTPAREDPVFTFAGSSLDARGDGIPSEFEQALRDLRIRIRQAHDRHLLGKVRAILDACRSWQVQLVVFPEYAIPWEILADVARAAGDMVVVAGTHQVDQQAIAHGVYRILGWQEDPEPGWAVCPVLCDGKLIGLQPKLRPIEGEAVAAGEAWHPIPLPSELPGPLAIEICRDFLEAFGHGKVAELTAQEEDSKLLAVPSYTPTSSLATDFDPLAGIRAHRFGRPVLYANIANQGGSTIWTDVKVTEGDFPEHTSRLPAGCEGVIVADVDVEPEAPGVSTRYTGCAVVKPLAAATLVLRARAADDCYSRWLTDVGGTLDSGAKDMAAFTRAVQGASESLRAWGGGCEARRRRLDRLVRTVEHLTRPEQGLQLLREVVVPESVLPLDGLRRAMARGAAEMVLHWLSTDGRVRDAHFGEVESRLRRAAGDPDSSGWTEAGAAVIATVIDEVRGDVPAPHPGNVEPHFVVQQKLLRVLGEQLTAIQDEAIAHFEAQRFEAALEAFERMLGCVQEASSVALDDPTWRKRDSGVRSNIASCELALQRIDDARGTLLAIDPDPLEPEGKAIIASACAQVGEVDRARAILQELDASPESESLATVREAKQMLALAQGEVPEKLEPVPHIRLRAASLRLEQGDLAAAVELVLGQTPDASQGSSTALGALMVLTAALQRTVLEIDPVRVPVPRDVRGHVIAAIEILIRDLRVVELPKQLAIDAERTALVLYGITEDQPSARQALERLKDLGGYLPIRQRTQRLAEDGQLAVALAALPITAHPWRGRLERAELLAEAGEKDAALEEVSALAAEFPDRSPIESLLSRLLLGKHRAAEALSHAERAFDALPGRGQRITLARAALEAGEPRQAWYLLSPLKDSKEPNVLGLRAAAAESVSPSQSVTLWRDYLEQRPDDASTRVRLASLLHILNLPGAAEEAWEAFQRHERKDENADYALDPNDLFTCGFLQLLHEPNRQRRDERISAIADALRSERFRDDAVAEGARIRLLTESGLGFGQHPPDWRILERGGLARALPVEEVISTIRRQGELNEALLRWYRAGGIPFFALAQLRREPAARLLTRLIRASERGEGGICSPITSQSIDSLENAELLVSDLELLILSHVGALDGLRQLLGTKGKLLLFSDVHERILQDAAALPRRSELDRRIKGAEEVVALVHDEPDHREGGGGCDRADDSVLLASVQASEGSPAVLSFATVLEELSKRASISVAQKVRALDYVHDEERTVSPFPEPPPERALVTFEVLQQLMAHGLVKAAAELFPAGLFVSADSKDRLRRMLEEQQDERAASESAHHVNAFVAEGLCEGWLKVIHDDDDIAEVPPARKGEGNAFVRSVLLEMVRSRVVLERRPDCLLVTADFFGTRGLGDEQTARALAWSDFRSFNELSARVGAVASRVVSVSDVVALGDEANERLRQLARMGMKDVVTPELLLGLMDEYGRLDAGEPKALLDWAEWTLREPGHLAGAFGVIHTAGVYARAIWETFSSNEASRAPREPDQTLRASLLARVEAVDRDHPAGALDMTLAFLAEMAAKTPSASYVHSHDDVYKTSRAMPAGRLWAFLREWAGPTGGRAASLWRAVRRAWFELDDDLRADDPRPGALLLAGEAVQKTERGLEIISPVSGVVATLSALWSERPLRHISLEIQFVDGATQLQFVPEDALQFGARLLKDNPKSIDGNEAWWRFGYAPQAACPPIAVVAPPEAVMLRADPDVLAATAPRWLPVVGALDGRFHDILMRIVKDPTDESTRRSFARLAAGGPWRLVREDPSYLRFWGGDAAAGFDGPPKDLAELEAMLAEPPGEIDSDAILLRVLGKRINEGSWAKRPDRQRLVLQALKIPGSLVAMDVVVRKRLDLDEEVRDALWNLDHPDECSCGVLAADICLLRHAAATQPLVESSGTTVDLREILPARLQTLVETERRRASLAVDEPLFVREARGAASNFADNEAAILRICRSALGRLIHGTPISPRRGTWLTWRLFQWVCAQLDALGADDRAAGIDALRRHDPGPWLDRDPRPQDDLLDPLWFDRRGIRHRLAAVLYGIGVMEDLARLLAREQDSKQPEAVIAALSTDGLQKLLGELASEEPTAVEAAFAQRQGEVSSLGWDLAASIPRMALQTLLRLDLDGLRYVAESAIVRHVEAIPTHADTDTRHGRLGHVLIAACAFRAESMGTEVREALARKLGTVTSGPAASLWKALGFASLFAAGEAHLADAARAEVERILGHEEAPRVLGIYLLGIAHNAADIAPVVGDILAVAERQEVDPMGLAGAVGRIVLEGAPEAREAAGACLRELGNREPYKGDERFSQLLDFLAIPVDA